MGRTRDDRREPSARGGCEDPFAVLRPDARARLVPAEQPRWIDPMLATLTSARFSDPGWIFERKLDGERCLAFRSGSEVRMLSRNRLEVGDQYPEVVQALAAQPCGDLVLDGEVVAFEGGRTSFARLQRRMHVSRPSRALLAATPVVYYVFDVPHAEGHDARGVPLRDRKALLRRLVRAGGSLRLAAHRNADGEAYWRSACERGWEGVIAKRADSPYVAGRSRDWLKFKCVNEQEFVIGGFTEPKGARTGLGALLLGYHEAGRFRYAGKVGTGFDQRTLADLTARLEALEVPEPPFDGPGLPRKGVHWARPELVAQIGFSEWTEDGQLRHPRFLGLRQDKPPNEVVRERPVP
jgi:bifunctional non-homologous end joining protein LigD